MMLGWMRSLLTVALLLTTTCVVCADSEAERLTRLREVLQRSSLAEPGAPQLPPVAKTGSAKAAAAKSTLSTIADEFDDGSIDQTIWQVTSSGVSESGGQLRLVCAADSEVYALTRQGAYSYNDDLVMAVDFSDLVTSGSCASYCYLMGDSVTYMLILQPRTTQTLLSFMAYNNQGVSTSTQRLLPGNAGKLKLRLDHATRVVECDVDEGAGWQTVGNSGNVVVPARELLKGALMAWCGTRATCSVRFDHFNLQGNAFELPPLGGTGLFESMSISSAGYNRAYRLLVPNNYQPSRPVGIVFGYQGYGSPYSTILKYDFEPEAERCYWICVSIPVKVEGGYNTVLNATSNEDIRCTMDIFNLIKANYQVDENRAFATGFSNGAYFSVTLANTVPHFLAAINPNASPNWSTSGRLSRSDYAAIACGGNSDPYDSVGCVNALRAYFLGHTMDGGLYACNMGHTTPNDDRYVSPAKSWDSKVVDYFMIHPRDYQTVLYDPPALAESFRDDFDSTATRPAAARWHLDYFDQYGLLGDLAGCVFRQTEGALTSQRLSASMQGGVCSSGFLPHVVDWETSFTMTDQGTGLTVWPAVLSDMTGKVLSLSLTSSGWTWRTSTTHLAFRVGLGSAQRTVDSGTVAFATGQSYILKLTRRAGITWSIEDAAHQTVASGSLSAADSLAGPVEVGFGLRTATGEVRFDYAEARSTRLNAAEHWALY